MTTKKALIQVSDTTNLHKLAPFLIEQGFELVSWGKSRTYLKQHNIKARDITDDELQRIDDYGIADFSIVVCNLNDIEKEINASDSTLDSVFEHVEQYVLHMIRSAATEYKDTIILVTPSDYDTFMELYSRESDLNTYARVMCAQKAFAHTSKYDSILSQYLYVGSMQLRNSEKK